LTKKLIETETEMNFKTEISLTLTNYCTLNVCNAKPISDQMT